MLQRWRAVGDTVFGVTGPGIKPQTFLTDSDVLNITALTGRCSSLLPSLNIMIVEFSLVTLLLVRLVISGAFS